MGVQKDVAVKHVEAIASFAKNLGPFVSAFDGNAQSMLRKTCSWRQTLIDKLESIRGLCAEQEADVERARQELTNALNEVDENGKPDPGEVARCRDRIARLQDILVKMRACESECQSAVMRLQQVADDIDERTRRLQAQYARFADVSRTFLKKAEADIRSYNETHLKR